MRILHLTDCYLPMLGGIETQVHHLAQQQRAAGDDAVVLTATPAAPGDRGRSVERLDGVPVFRLAARFPGGLPVHPWPWPHARRLLERLDPDVVHVHMGGLTPTAQALLPMLMGQRRAVVLTVHSVWRPRTAVPAYTALDRLVGWSRWPLLLTSVSQMAAARVRQAAGGRAEVHVLRNGVDVDLWRGEHLPTPAGTVHAVTAGRFASRKRILPLLEALHTAGEVVGGPTPFRVTVAGEGPELPAARALLAERGMQDWVELPGRLTREELVELYHRAQVYLAPGVDDAFSVAVQEAQAAGLAIVSRAQSGAAELVEHEVTGLLAEDDDALARAVVRLVRGRDLLGRITAHNRAVPPATAWPTVVAQTAEAYRRAAALTRR